MADPNGSRQGKGDMAALKRPPAKPVTKNELKSGSSKPRGKKETVGPLMAIPAERSNRLTIQFPYPDYFPVALHHRQPSDRAVLLRPAPRENQRDTGLDRKGKQVACYFKICRGTHRYNCVVNTLRRAGLREVSEESDHWNVRWGGYLAHDSFRNLKAYQKVNHFPGSSLMGRKDNLARNVQRLARLHRQADFAFLPETYIFPGDRSLFTSRLRQLKSKNRVWIIKPINSACGKGIRLVTSPDEIPQNRKMVVSKYISNPYLIEGRKFDLRLYVLVTSFNPLKVYLYGEGLVRFAVQEYSNKTSSLKKRLAHLTNYSLNKKSKDYVRNTAVHDASASKWKLSALAKYLESRGTAWRPVLERIHGVIIKTLVSIEHKVASSVVSLGAPPDSIFEIYGFDVLLDSSLKPHLLEVNVMPSLSSSSALDKQIKVGMITDLFHLIGVQAVDPLKDNTKRDKRRSETSLRSLTRSKSIGRRNKRRPLSVQTPRTTMDLTSVWRKSHRHAHVLEERPLVGALLMENDLQVIRSFAGELDRLGNFECIYPTPTNTARFSGLFTPRYLNVLLRKWVKLSPEQREAVLSGTSVERADQSTLYREVDSPSLTPLASADRRKKKQHPRRSSSDRMNVRIRSARSGRRSRGSARFERSTSKTTTLAASTARTSRSTGDVRGGGGSRGVAKLSSARSSRARPPTFKASASSPNVRSRTAMAASASSSSFSSTAHSRGGPTRGLRTSGMSKHIHSDVSTPSPGSARVPFQPSVVSVGLNPRARAQGGQLPVYAHH